MQQAKEEDYKFKAGTICAGPGTGPRYQSQESNNPRGRKSKGTHHMCSEWALSQLHKSWNQSGALHCYGQAHQETAVITPSFISILKNALVLVCVLK